MCRKACHLLGVSRRIPTGFIMQNTDQKNLAEHQPILPFLWPDSFFCGPGLNKKMSRQCMLHVTMQVTYKEYCVKHQTKEPHRTPNGRTSQNTKRKNLVEHQPILLFLWPDSLIFVAHALIKRCQDDVRYVSQRRSLTKSIAQNTNRHHVEHRPKEPHRTPIDSPIFMVRFSFFCGLCLNKKMSRQCTLCVTMQVTYQEYCIEHRPSSSYRTPTKRTSQNTD